MTDEYTSVSLKVDSTYNGSEYGTRCGVCGAVYFPLGNCDQCGHHEYVGVRPDMAVGLFCPQCKKGFSSWTCFTCGETNATGSSLIKKKSDCFIATATMGHPEAYEVRILRHFRDEHLKRYVVGREIVRIYERSSPSLARLIANRQGLRRFSYNWLIKPLTKVITNFYKGDFNNVKTESLFAKKHDGAMS